MNRLVMKHALLVALTLLANGAVAADPAPKKMTMVQKEPEAKAAARHAQTVKLDIPKADASAVPSGAAITAEALKTMLDNMGYEPQAYAYTNGVPYYVITVARD